MRKAVKGLSIRGVCPEEDCPYPSLDLIKPNVSSEMKKRRLKTIDQKLSPSAFEHASAHKIAVYKRLDSDRPDDHEAILELKKKRAIGQRCLRNLRACLAEGFPVAFSFWYYLPINKSFRMNKDGKYILKDIWNDETSSAIGEVSTTHVDQGIGSSIQACRDKLA